MSSDPLEMLMGRYRREILGTVLSRPGQEFRVRELQRLTRIPVGSLSRELALLVEGGLLRRRLDQGRVAYSVDPRYPVLPELSTLFAASYGAPAYRQESVADPVAEFHRQVVPLKFSQPALARTCRKYHVRRLSLFGSMVRGDATPESDIDLLADFAKARAPGLRTLAAFKQDLSQIFQGRDVDLVTGGALENPYRRQSIIKDMEVLYEEREEGRGVSVGYAAGLPRDS